MKGNVDRKTNSYFDCVGICLETFYVGIVLTETLIWHVLKLENQLRLYNIQCAFLSLNCDTSYRLNSILVFHSMRRPKNQKFHRHLITMKTMPDKTTYNQI